MIDPDLFLSPEKQKALAADALRAPITALHTAILWAIDADRVTSTERHLEVRHKTHELLSDLSRHQLLNQIRCGKGLEAIRAAIVEGIQTLRAGDSWRLSADLPKTAGANLGLLSFSA